MDQEFYLYNKKYIPFEYINARVDHLFEVQCKEYLDNRDLSKYTQTIDDISKEVTAIEAEHVDELFPPRSDESEEYNLIIQKVRKVFKKRLSKTHYLRNKDALFLYDSGVNLIATEINVTNLVACLCAGRIQALIELSYRLLSRFYSTNQNILRLLKYNNDPYIFKKQNRFSDLGSLSRLRDDLASMLFAFFPKPFFSDSCNKFKMDPNQKADILAACYKHYPKEELQSKMSLTRSKLLLTFAEYFVYLHTNIDFCVYSKKRWEFLKRILIGVINPKCTQQKTGTEQVKTLDEHRIRKLFGGFLMTNKQLAPDEDLIFKITSEGFSEEEYLSIRERNMEFFDQLTPSTLYQLQRDLSFTLSYLKSIQQGEHDNKIVDKFLKKRFIVDEEESFSLIGTWLVEMFDKGFIEPTPEIVAKVESIKEKIEEEKRVRLEAEEKIKSNINKKLKAGTLPRSVNSIFDLKRKYFSVKTDTNFFCGEGEGCAMREYDDSLQLFYDYRVMQSVNFCFQKVFEYVSRLNFRHNIVQKSFEGKNQGTEFYLPLKVVKHDQPYIFATGITYAQGITLRESNIIEAYLPYVILFGTEKTAGSLMRLNRKIVGEDTNYYHLPLSPITAPLFHELLYDFFHFLSNEDWEHKEVQKVLRYIKELPKTKKGQHSHLVDQYWEKTKKKVVGGMYS